MTLTQEREASPVGEYLDLDASPMVAPEPPSPEIERQRSTNILSLARSWLELGKTKYGLTPVLVLTFIGFAQIFETQAFNIAGPDIRRDLGISLVQIIAVVQTVGLISIFASLPLAWYLDRRPRVRAVGLATVVSGIAAILSTRTHTEGTLSATRALDAAGEQAQSVPIYGLLADYYPLEMRGRIYVVLSSLLNVAGLAALAVVGTAVTFYGWRSTTFVLAIPLILAGLGAVVLLREPIRGYLDRKSLGLSEEAALVPDEPQSFGESWRTTWSIRTLRRTFVADMVSTIGSNAYTYFFAFFLAEQYGLDAQHRSFVAIPAVVAGMLGGFVGGALLDKFSRFAPSQILRTASVFGLITSVGVVIAAQQPPLWVLVGAGVLAAFGGALSGPATFAVQSQIIKANVRTLGLTIYGLYQVPAILVLGYFAIIQQQYGYQPVFYLCLPFIVVGALIRITAADLFEVDRRNQLIAAGADAEAKQAQREGRDKLLVARSVDVGYDGTQVLFGVDFEVEAGEIIALLGTNGAGKSTLLKAISGGQEASAGAIVFDGRDITHMPPHEIAQRGVVYMPGGRGTFPGLTVEENLSLATWMLDDPAEKRRLLDRVFEIFPVLQRRSGELAQSLSGGEQQMLSLSQAFLAKPRLLMIDELSLGLSPQVVGELLEIVRQINAAGTTIIVVEQSVNVALEVAQRAMFMEKGEVKFVGATADLMQRPDILRSVYVKGTGGGGAGVLDPAARQRREDELARAGGVLQAIQVTKTFGGIKALDGVSLELRQGEILGLIGPNGSGKTTLFDIISGYQPADSGKIIYEGVDITLMPAHERARRKLVRRFQDARLFPSLTVYETLLVALDQRLEVKATAAHAIALPQARRAEKRNRARADRLVELLGLGAYRDKFVRELSTGLRRIVDLAFVLATEPKVLLLDEPSSGIAQAEAESLAPLLRRVKYETGCSVLIIEHDIPLITAISDELIALDLGEVVKRGTAEEVLNDERVIASYLGSSRAALQRSGSLT